MEQLSETTDVLVVGGGTAGVVAALQAARAGAKTTVVEATGQLGGTITNGGVCAPALFWSADHQVIAGIGWELVCRCKELDGTPWPPLRRSRAPRPSYHAAVNPYVYAAVAEELCLEAGVTLHYHEFIDGIRDAGGPWLARTRGRGVERKIRAREVIDCTGDAIVIRQLGLAVERGDVVQPGTLEFRFRNMQVADLTEAQVDAAYRQALADGRLHQGDFCYADRSFMTFLRGTGFNLLHVFSADSSTAPLQTDANIRGRAAVLRLLRFVQTLPGCRSATIEMMRPDTAVRETVRIVGETRVTVDDYLAGRVFDDAVGYSIYFVDEHTRDGTSQRFLERGVVPTLPFGALIPRGSERVLTAGRAISADRLAHSALRIQCSCMVMGQAAGAAAALGVQRAMPSRNVPLEDLRDLLRQHDAIIPPELRPLPELGPEAQPEV